jgi:hypothetical protein
MPTTLGTVELGSGGGWREALHGELEEVEGPAHERVDQIWVGTHPPVMPARAVGMHDGVVAALVADPHRGGQLRDVADEPGVLESVRRAGLARCRADPPPYREAVPPRIGPCSRFSRARGDAGSTAWLQRSPPRLTTVPWRSMISAMTNGSQSVPLFASVPNAEAMSSGKTSAPPRTVEQNGWAGLLTMPIRWAVSLSASGPTIWSMRCTKYTLLEIAVARVMSMTPPPPSE